MVNLLYYLPGRRLTVRSSAIFLLLALSALKLFAQEQQVIDQMNARVENTRNPDTMVFYAKIAQQKAKDIHYKLGEGVATKAIGNYDHIKGNFSAARRLYEIALPLIEPSGSKFETAKIYLSLAIVNSNLNDHDKAIMHGVKSLRLFEELKDQRGQGKILNLLGISSASSGEFLRAKEYFKKYYTLAKLGKDTIDIGYSNNNLGNIYRELKMTDSAMHFYKIAARLFKTQAYLAGIALADKNIGSIYFDRKDFKNALVYAQRSLQTNTKLGNLRFVGVSHKEIGVCYRELGDTINAYKHFRQAVAIAKATNDKALLRDGHACLAELDNAKLDYKSAYQNLAASRAAHDSLVNIEKTKIVQELTTKYETAEKEKTIKNLNQQRTIDQLKINQRNIMLWVALFLLIGGVVVTFLVISRRKFKEKARLQASLNKQQEETTKAVLSAEENERTRIAKDLHDGVGQLLSSALMNLNALSKELSYSNDSQKIKTENALSLINESYDEMRHISHQMMPNALIKAGLTTAVKDFLNKIDQDKLKISLETIGLNSRLDQQIEAVLYRVIQETVNNVIKHAKADKLAIQLLNDEDGISITIEDNGKGFDTKALHEGEGIGLKNIISRIAFLKGSIDFDSTPGKGTLVAIHIPN